MDDDSPSNARLAYRTARLTLAAAAITAAAPLVKAIINALM